MTTINGTVKRLVSDKGFGFVAAEDGSEYFFHQSACAQFDTLREGQQVTFKAGRAPRGRAPRMSFSPTEMSPAWASACAGASLAESVARCPRGLHSRTLRLRRGSALAETAQ